MIAFDFSVFSNVRVTGADLSAMNEQEISVLYEQARYCQAMTDADIDVMRELVSEDMVFTHMSGKKQTREEYFADVADGSLNYHTIGIEKPVVKVDGDRAEITYTSVLNADAYGAKGTFRMSGTHHYEKMNRNAIHLGSCSATSSCTKGMCNNKEKRDGKWIIVNG